MDNRDKAAFSNNVFSRDLQVLKDYGSESGPGEMAAYNSGLTKREYFALHIYAGILSAHNQEGEITTWDCAECAVNEADQLLKALNLSEDEE